MEKQVKETTIEFGKKNLLKESRGNLMFTLLLVGKEVVGRQKNERGR